MRRALGNRLPRREFLHVDDMAAACLHVGLHTDSIALVNIGIGADVTIRELAEQIAQIVGYHGGLNLTQPNPMAPHKVARCLSTG